jgi:hypothetical protein
MKKKIQDDMEKYKNIIKYVNSFNENRNNIVAKIGKIR